MQRGGARILKTTLDRRATERLLVVHSLRRRQYSLTGVLACSLSLRTGRCASLIPWSGATGGGLASYDSIARTSSTGCDWLTQPSCRSSTPLVRLRVLRATVGQ